MISKRLIFVLLASSLVLANPIQGKPALRPQSVVNIGTWLEQAHNEIKKSFEQTVQPFKKTYSALIEANRNVQKYSQDKVEELRSKFLAITIKSREMLSDIENFILMGRVVDLQKAIDDLKILVNAIIKQNNQGTNENIQTGQKPGNQNPQNLFDFSNVMKISNLHSGELPNFRHGLQNAVGVKNVINNIPSDFRQFPSLEIPTSINQFKGFLPQQEFDSVKNNLNEFVNQAQGVFNGRIDEMPNNLFSSLINNFQELSKETDNNINDISQTLSIIQKQLSQAVSNEINKLKEALTQWSDEVDKFLAEPILPQPEGFMPGVPLSPSDDGLFSNFGQQVGGSVGSGVDKFTNAVGGFFNNAGKLFSV